MQLIFEWNRLCGGGGGGREDIPIICNHKP